MTVRVVLQTRDNVLFPHLGRHRVLADRAAVQEALHPSGPTGLGARLVHAGVVGRDDGPFAHDARGGGVDAERLSGGSSVVVHPPRPSQNPNVTGRVVGDADPVRVLVLVVAAAAAVGRREALRRGRDRDRLGRGNRRVSIQLRLLRQDAERRNRPVAPTGTSG